MTLMAQDLALLVFMGPGLALRAIRGWVYSLLPTANCLMGGGAREMRRGSS
jgi:hypothetical protein